MGKRGSYAKSELRKQAINEAALALVMERGHRSVTVAEVAARAGVSEPSVFYHFPTVDVLTVGNGDVAMTVDVSGLQTCPGFHELRPAPSRVPYPDLDGLPPKRPRAFARDDFQIPLRTQSSWGWYATRGRREYLLSEVMTPY